MFLVKIENGFSLFSFEFSDVCHLCWFTIKGNCSKKVTVKGGGGHRSGPCVCFKYIYQICIIYFDRPDMVGKSVENRLPQTKSNY